MSALTSWQAALLALTAASVSAQSLPMSEPSFAAFMDAADRSPRFPRGLRGSEVVRRYAATLPSAWTVVCDTDKLTGESSNCRLESPMYMPAGWEFADCGNGSDCFRAWGGDVIRLGLQISVHCDGTVKKPKLLPLTMRFMVGEEVIAAPESPEVLFRSPDGSWADNVLALEQVGREHVWRFKPDAAAVREFMSGPHCSGAEQ